jgi:hypothetical protein
VYFRKKGDRKKKDSNEEKNLRKQCKRYRKATVVRKIAGERSR